MDIQWSLIWTYSNAAAARSRKRRDPFADPLEGSQWDGLGWSVPLFSRMIASRRAPQENRQKIKEVERFTGAVPARTVCVS